MQELVGGDGAFDRYAQLFQPVAFQIGDAADGDQQAVEGNAYVLAGVFGDEYFLAVLDQELLRLVPGEHVYTFGAKAPGHELGHFRVFAHQDARRHFDLRDLGA